MSHRTIKLTYWTCTSCQWVNHKLACANCGRKKQASEENVAIFKDSELVSLLRNERFTEGRKPATIKHLLDSDGIPWELGGDGCRRK